MSTGVKDILHWVLHWPARHVVARRTLTMTAAARPVTATKAIRPVTASKAVSPVTGTTEITK